MVRMDRALPVIPTFKCIFRRYPTRRGQNLDVYLIRMTRINPMIHLRPISLLVRLAGISRRTDD
jgi:hypothetical protein